MGFVGGGAGEGSGNGVGAGSGSGPGSGSGGCGSEFMDRLECTIYTGGLFLVGMVPGRRRHARASNVGLSIRLMSLRVAAHANAHGQSGTHERVGVFIGERLDVDLGSRGTVS